MSNYHPQDKVQTIVKNKLIKEKVKFQGKTITRERIELQWNIPKIINTDVGYQLLFGNRPSLAKNKQDSGIHEMNIDDTIK
jgi:hypothetical protein